MKQLCILFAVISATAQLASAADWTRFRGPNGSGVAPDAKPPTVWSESQNLAWKLALPGPGSSSPIVLGERIFVTCYSDYGVGSGGADSVENLKRHLLCVERKSGKVLWDKAVPADLPEDAYSGNLREHGYASSTPATDGERIYVFFGKTGALAFDLSGQQLWKVSLGNLSSNRRWGSAASPILYKNLVIVNAAEEGRAVCALDKRTGKEVWKAETGSLELSYVTPVLAENAAGQTDLAIAVPGELWGMNPDSGKLRWFAQTGMPGNVSPSVIAADGVLYTTGGYPRQSTLAVRTGGKGDVTQTHIVWTSTDASYIPSPVIVNGLLFVVSDQAYALCLDAKTGKQIYRERLPGFSGSKQFYASMVAADGHLYAVSRRGGTFVLAAKPEFKIVSKNRIMDDDTDFNATPALSGRQLFLRSNRYLYCIGTGAGG